MNRWLIVALAAVAGSALAAGAKWQAIGETANGNKVFIDAASYKAGAKLPLVTFRTELKEPMDTPGGGIKSLRSRMRVNCADMTAAGVDVILWENEAKNQAFARNSAAKVEYVKEPAGSSADLVVKHVCRK